MALTFLLGLLAAAATLSGAIASVGLGLLAAWVLLAAARARRPLPPVPFAAATGAFVLWGLLMIPFSLDPLFSLGMAARFGILAALWVGPCLLDTPRRRRAALAGLAGGAVANAAITLLTQDYAWDLTGRRITMVQGSAPTGAWILGLSALTMLAFAAHLPRLRTRLLLGLGAVPPLAAVLLSQTRSAWLGLGAGLLMLLLASRRRTAAVLLLAAVVLLIVGPPALRQRALASFDPADDAVGVRLKQWRVGLELVAWRPVTGVGDVYLSDIARIRTGFVDRLDADMHHLHHSVLTAAAFWGVPGAVFFLVLLGRLLWLLLRAWRGPPPDDPVQRAWTLAALAAWAFYFTAGLADALLVDRETSLLFLLILGAGLIPTSTRVGSRP